VLPCSSSQFLTLSLSNIISGSSVAPAKLDEVQRKLNILNVFQEKEEEVPVKDEL
jgi:hypothetical protein